MYLNSRKFLTMISRWDRQYPTRQSRPPTPRSRASRATRKCCHDTFALRTTHRPTLSRILLRACWRTDQTVSHVQATGNWSFRQGTVAPPRHCPEITSAALAIGHGQAIPFGQYLRAEPILDADTRRALADVFDPGPDASSKWRLRFRHTGRGFPRSQLKNTLILAEIGHRALKLRGNGMKWHEVYREMPHSETLIKKAVQLVLKSRLGKPLD
jgi:hypothetical protein